MNQNGISVVVVILILAVAVVLTGSVLLPKLHDQGSTNNIINSYSGANATGNKPEPNVTENELEPCARITRYPNYHKVEIINNGQDCKIYNLLPPFPYSVTVPANWSARDTGPHGGWIYLNNAITVRERLSTEKSVDDVVDIFVYDSPDKFTPWGKVLKREKLVVGEHTVIVVHIEEEYRGEGYRHYFFKIDDRLWTVSALGQLKESEVNLDKKVEEDIELVITQIEPLEAD